MKSICGLFAIKLFSQCVMIIHSRVEERSLIIIKQQNCTHL